MARATVGKNARCPCGSGRRYKSCCLRVQETRAAALRVARALRRAEQERNAEVCDLVLYLIDEQLGTDPFRSAPLDVRDPSMHDLLAPWAAYQPAILDTVGSLLADTATREQLDWLDAQRGSILGLWRVVGLDADGACVQLRCRLTGVARTVLDPAEAAVLELDDHVVARVVPIDDHARLVGRYPQHLSAGVVDHFLPMFREAISAVCDVPLEGLLTPDQVADNRAIYALLTVADAVAERVRDGQTPDPGYALPAR